MHDIIIFKNSHQRIGHFEKLLCIIYWRGHIMMNLCICYYSNMIHSYQWKTMASKWTWETDPILNGYKIELPGGDEWNERMEKAELKMQVQIYNKKENFLMETHHKSGKLQCTGVLWKRSKMYLDGSFKISSKQWFQRNQMDGKSCIVW